MEIYYVFQENRIANPKARFNGMYAIIVNDNGSVRKIAYNRKGHHIVVLDELPEQQPHEVWMRYCNTTKRPAVIRMRLLEKPNCVYLTHQEMQNTPLFDAMKYMTTAGFFAKSLKIGMYLVYSFDALYEAIQEDFERV